MGRITLSEQKGYLAFSQNRQFTIEILSTADQNALTVINGEDGTSTPQDLFGWTVSEIRKDSECCSSDRKCINDSIQDKVC